MNIGNIFAGGKQLVSMGAGPFFLWIAVGAFVMGLGVGAYPTFLVTRAIYQRQALRAEVNLSKFEAVLANNAANGQAEARRQLEQAYAAQTARDQGINNRLDAGFAALDLKLSRQNAAFRSAINDPKFACLRIPYPAESLRLLTRPGGSVAAGDREDPGAGEPSASLF